MENMEIIFNRVKCFDCKHILQSPIILPCFKTVCNKHVPKQDISHYFCLSCQKNHNIPKNGYARNMVMENFIELNLPAYKRAFDSSELFKSTIDGLERLTNEPRDLINEAIGDLKSQIKRRREKLIQEIKLNRVRKAIVKNKTIKMIDERFGRVLIEMDMYEKECVNGLESLSNELGEIGNKLVKKKREFEEWQSELSEYHPECQAKWHSIEFLNKREGSPLLKILESFRSKLFLGKFELFERKKDEICGLNVLDFAENEKFGFIFQYF